MPPLGAVSWGAWLAVVLLAWLLRSRLYAVFRAVTLGLHNLIAVPLLGTFPEDGAILPVLLGLHALVFVESLVLVRPGLRPLGYRLLVSWPAMYFAASVLLAFPWAIAVGFGLPPHGWFVPFALGAVGMFQSLTARRESLDLVVGQGVTEATSLVRLPLRGGPDQRQLERARQQTRPLRIVQITDPHLGPFMPVARLRRIAERAVAAGPDLVLLTGDFLTMESQREGRYLAEALSPLRALEGRVFACLGNHDHEALPLVVAALESARVTLLVDRAALVETAVGTVQILGFDFHFRDRKERTSALLSAFPRVAGALRLVLLHDPGAFKLLPPSEADLVLSGHTHGGQVGLVSLGHPWTVAGWIARIPDHGLFAHGTSRLYVHRGTGHYGFPLRLGVPAEESVVSVHLAVG